jgi:hypothetical protein
MSVAVKTASHAVPALKWIQAYATRESAHTPFGSYYVELSLSGFRWGYCFDEHYDEENFVCDSADEGKAAAQKDWAERTDEMFAEATAPLLAGFCAIVDRADNNMLGTSKVQDIRRIAADLFAKHGGAQ